MNTAFQPDLNASPAAVRSALPGGLPLRWQTGTPQGLKEASAKALPDASGRAFTLIELILVMAMLAAILSVAAPKLSRFFSGRSLELESGRLLALTRYGQYHAASLGAPMVLWLDVKQGAYGLRQESTFSPGDQTLPDQASYQENDNDRPLTYFLNKDLELFLDNQERHTNGVATIVFYPDGSIDENSLKLFFLSDKDNNSVPFVQTRNRLHYEISDQTNRWTGTKR